MGFAGDDGGDAASDAGVWAIVLAAGLGVRYGALKQYAYAGDHRLIDWSCAAASAAGARVVLVVRPGQQPTAPSSIASAIVPGGRTRSLSVSAGLAAVPASARVIMVHDAAHPNAGTVLFAAVRAALEGDETAAAAVPAIPVNETLIRAGSDGTAAGVAERGSLQVQMPHAFRPDALHTVAASGVDVSDEMSALLRMRLRVVLVPGDPGNVHVTSPAELAVVNLLLSRRELPVRHGGDSARA
jgi:2-C-methyl-D-erythritol 4-phosphate cytidylyltransferase